MITEVPILRTAIPGCVMAVLVFAGMDASATGYPGADWIPADPANYTPSDRPDNGLTVRWVVIHDIEGTAAGAISWFQNPNAQASAHYIVDYDGSVYPNPVQMVRDEDIAWHAGNWAYNQRSIGIEHSGYAGQDLYTEWEYHTSAKLTAWLLRTYGVPPTHPSGIAPADPTSGSGIIGHDQVPDPNDPSKGGGSGHHTDPGPYWNWTHYMDLVRLYLGPPLNSTYSGENVTAVMEAGRQYVVWVEYLNTGWETWSPGGGTPVRLGTWMPADRDSEFYTPGNWPDPHRPTDVDTTTPPGSVGRFTFIMSAPHVAAGTYQEHWRLIREGTGWFGDANVSFSVTVQDTIPPAAGHPLEPADRAALNTSSVTFRWTPANDTGSGIRGYRVIVSRSADLNDTASQVLIHESWNTSDPLGTEVTASIPEGSFHWGVVAFDNATNRGFYPSRQFSVALPEPPPPVDTVPPELISVFPTGADVGTSSPVVLEFSEEMRADSVRSAVRLSGEDSAPLNLTLRARSGRVFVLLPEGGLHPSTTYIVSVNRSASDLAGNVMAHPVEWSFTTLDIPPPFPDEPTPTGPTAEGYVMGGLMVVSIVLAAVALTLAVKRKMSNRRLKNQHYSNR